jgi:hypothetical protein
MPKLAARRPGQAASCQLPAEEGDRMEYKFKFPASIEYEYNTPEGSDVLTEMKKCVEYCKKALA